jgi:hypothetical protein
MRRAARHIPCCTRTEFRLLSVARDAEMPGDDLEMLVLRGMECAGGGRPPGE